MKKLLIILFAMAGMFAVAGCNKDIEPVQVAEQAVKFTINSSAPQTKTYIEYDENAHTYTPNWHSDDQIGVFVDSWASDENPKATFSNTKENGPTGSFSGSLTTTNGTHTLYAFYPAGQFDKAYNDQKIGITIPETQMPTATSFDRSADILVTAPYPLTVSGSSVVINDMQFTRVVSLLKVVVSDGTADGRLASDVIKSITLTSGMQNAALTGRFVWDFANGTGTMDSGERSASIKADLSANPIAVDGANPIYLLVNPTTLTSGSSLTVTITTDNHEISKTATLPKDFVFPAGNVANLGITIKDSDTVEELFTPGWYLVTSVSELQAGDKVVIANASSTKAAGVQNSGSNYAYRSRVDVQLNSDNTLDVKTAAQFTLANGSQTGTFAFKEGGKYLNAVSGNNWLQTEHTSVAALSSWNITIISSGSTGSTVSTVIQNVGASDYSIQENAQESGNRFSCYKTAQQPVLLYKYYESAPQPGPTITALKTSIEDVPAAGGSATETDVYSLTDATDADLTVTTDGTVVTSASAASGSVSYVVAENINPNRNGWIRISVSGGNIIEITVSQLAGVHPWAPVYTSNVTMTPGTNGSTGKVKINNTEYDAVKVGTGNKGGTMTITVPANKTKLYIHAAAWNGVTGLSLNITGATVSPSSISLKSDSGISGNTPYTFTGDPTSSDYFFIITIPESSTATTLTFTTSTAKRFVIWGCNVDGEDGGGSGGNQNTTVTTSSAQVNSASAAVLKGSFSGATGTVVASGFVWGESADNLNHDIQLGSQTGTAGSLSFELTGLMAAQTYYYKAYVQVRNEGDQEAITVYGSVLSFTTLAELSEIRTGWLELPAITGSEDYTGCFYGTGGETSSGTNRNYSYNYDAEHFGCLWVAYPLRSNQLSGTASSDSWTANPFIPREKQVWIGDNAYGVHYNASTYDRGHQIPKGDRKIDDLMFAQTHYFTNQTPQLHDFNGKIWEKLERAVRTEAANTDTIYVVTGACYQTVGGNETINQLSGVQSEQKPTNPMLLDIPNYYWKALLKVTRSGGQVVSASTIGFWFEHKVYSDEDYAAHVMSVNEIEAKIGFDLFTNLPASIQEDVEGNTSWTVFQNYGQ